MDFFTLLTVLFIGLKLTGHLSWSWWLVLLPAYAPILVAVVAALIVLTIKAMR